MNGRNKGALSWIDRQRSKVFFRRPRLNLVQFLSCEHWKWVPELQHLAPELRRKTWDATIKSVRGRKWRLFALIVVVANLILLFDYRIGNVLRAGGSIACGVAITGLHLRLLTAARRRIQSELRAEYAGRHLPTCLKCSYPLHGCSDSATECPECGNNDILGDPPNQDRNPLPAGNV